MNTQPTDDGLRAIASNNLNAVKLALTTSEEQRQSLAEAIKQAESFLEKVTSWHFITGALNEIRSRSYICRTLPDSPLRG